MSGNKPDPDIIDAGKAAEREAGATTGLSRRKLLASLGAAGAFCGRRQLATTRWMPLFQSFKEIDFHNIFQIYKYRGRYHV
ncbi:hypothetical protein FE784_20430 [Paenibacillus hemerocallicola]|uniref:Uncharacterized protein n=1 Tax=Paenibacillus hemerocallicola TaxID=1172614 RepID=A0A5C4T608_9BACL|nr:hypothetical protein [Paenibacillus hemerocallicola]TNJ64488.1 hypothetical protein FE784_20430 [Paenibacillus hemerocallicola]